MSAIYRYLRGVDPTSGEADPERRLKLLGQLDDAAKECMEPTPWRDYLLRVKHAGFVSQDLIASKNAIVNAYAFYVRGRKVGIAKSKLDEMIARWVFGSLLTARYSGSSETIFEEDLTSVARLEANDADGFVRTLDDTMGQTTTGDYWTHSLVWRWRRRKQKLRLHSHSEQPRSFLEHGRSSRTSFFRTCSIRPQMVGARPAKLTIYLRKYGSIRGESWSVGALTKSQTWPTSAGTRIA